MIFAKSILIAMLGFSVIFVCMYSVLDFFKCFFEQKKDEE
jgi:hypothetical protein